MDRKVNFQHASSTCWKFTSRAAKIRCIFSTVVGLWRFSSTPTPPLPPPRGPPALAVIPGDDLIYHLLLLTSHYSPCICLSNSFILRSNATKNTAIGGTVCAPCAPRGPGIVGISGARAVGAGGIVLRMNGAFLTGGCWTGLGCGPLGWAGSHVGAVGRGRNVKMARVAGMAGTARTAGIAVTGLGWGRAGGCLVVWGGMAHWLINVLHCGFQHWKCVDCSEWIGKRLS